VTLSVTIITLNEAANIDACLASVAWADDVLVVDSGSTDDTVARAKAAGARVEVREWPGYSAQKNWAASQAKYDWILSLDADERISPALADEIRARVAAHPTAAGFRIARVTWHLGRWIRTTDWYPDYQLRLYDRRRARWKPRRVHESVEADGPVDVLSHEIEHYAYRDISHHHETMDRYTTLAAAEMYERGRRASIVDLALHPPAAFLRNYILRRGCLDGTSGFIVSAMNAYYVFLKFAKLRRLAAPGDSRSA
jgi:glycosyltransferase involved in cell wall biosynthesis